MHRARKNRVIPSIDNQEAQAINPSKVSLLSKYVRQIVYTYLPCIILLTKISKLSKSERQYLLDIKDSTILGDFREVSLDLGSNINEVRGSNINYLLDFAKRIKLVIDGNSIKQISKFQKMMLKIPEEFKEQQRISIRWTGPGFQKIIDRCYFKGYKMKQIELKDTKITHTN